MKKIIAIASVLLAVVACKKENIAENAPADGMVKVTFTADIPDCEFGKASLDGKVVVWEKGEKVAVYDGVNPDANSFEVVSVDGNKASISGEIAQTATELTAVYPFSAAKGSAEGNVAVNIPQGQIVPEGKSIDPNALVSVAKANVGENLVFRNVVSLIRFTVAEEGATSVLFVGNSGEKFFGTATVDPTTAVASNVGTSRGKVSAAAGTTFTKDAVYYAAVYPCEFPAGLNVTTAMSGCKYYRNSDKNNSFVRNSGLDLGNLAGGVKLPLTITTKAELDTWAQYAVCYVRGEKVSLGSDIDYENGEWKPVETFVGDFDGQDHSIYNMCIKGCSTVQGSSPYNCAGFFSLLSGSSVSNLKLGYNPSTSSYDGVSKMEINVDEMEYRFFAGALVGMVKGGKNIFDNVWSYVPVTVVGTKAFSQEIRLGGIMGNIGEGTEELKIKGVHVANNVQFDVTETISAPSSDYIGGILGTTGSSNVVIEDCHAESTAIIGTTDNAGLKVNCNLFVGGILGRNGKGLIDVSVKNCTNEGTVALAKNLGSGENLQIFMGGILGADSSTAAELEEYELEVVGCCNNGTVSSTPQSSVTKFGGICGYISSDSHFYQCTNLGSVLKDGNFAATEGCVGGIVGYLKKIGTVEECINGSSSDNSKGKVIDAKQTSSKNLFMGGVVGWAQAASRIINCKNYGEVSSLGGNTDNVAKFLGGVLGYCNTSTEGFTFSGNESYGPVTCVGTVNEGNDKFVAGGLIGYMSNSAISIGEGCKVDCAVTSCYPVSTAPTIAGLVVGKFAGTSKAIVVGTKSSPVVIGPDCKIGENAVTSTAGDFYYGKWIAGPAAGITEPGVKVDNHTIYAKMSE